MANVTKSKKVQKKSATTRAAAEKKRLDKVQKKYGGSKTGGMDTVVARKAKVTRKKVSGGMKTTRTARGDFISGKTGKVERKRK